MISDTLLYITDGNFTSEGLLKFLHRIIHRIILWMDVPGHFAEYDKTMESEIWSPERRGWDMKKQSLFLISVLALSLALSACGGGQSAEKTAETAKGSGNNKDAFCPSGK